MTDGMIFGAGVSTGMLLLIAAIAGALRFVARQTAQDVGRDAAQYGEREVAG